MFSAAKEIHSETGLRGLFQGHLATLLRIFPYAAIKFMAFEQYKIVSFGCRACQRAILTWFETASHANARTRDQPAPLDGRLFGR